MSPHRCCLETMKKIVPQHVIVTAIFNHRVGFALFFPILQYTHCQHSKKCNVVLTISFCISAILTQIYRDLTKFQLNRHAIFSVKSPKIYCQIVFFKMRIINSNMLGVSEASVVDGSQPRVARPGRHDACCTPTGRAGQGRARAGGPRDPGRARHGSP